MTSWKQGRRVLYHKYDQGKPNEFWEARLLDASLTIRWGRVLTWGASDVKSFNSPEEAQRVYEQLAVQKIEEGFELTQEGSTSGGIVDFDQLLTEIRQGVHKAFTTVREAHPDESINAYAMYSDDGAMTIVSVANSEESLRRTVANSKETLQGWYEEHGLDFDEEEYLWNSQEWTYNEGGEFLDVAYRRIIVWHERPDDPGEGEDTFIKFRDGLYETCVKALEALDRDGFFGVGDEREKAVVLFQVSDASQPQQTQAEWIRRLNPKSVYDRYINWCKL